MVENPQGGTVPSANESRRWLATEHQKDLREEREHDHLADEAGAGKRRRWWPFGKRRGK